MMAKILKHLVFGQKKNPPAPPRPDYQGEQCPKDEFSDHDYENIPKLGADQKKEVAFQEKKKPELVVFENYSEPADLLREIVNCNNYENDDCDPLYMSPVDDVTPSSWTKNIEEEDVYCVPFEDSEDVPPLPSPSMGPGYFSQTYGRKAVLMFSSILFTSSWLMIAYASSVPWICAGRIISGFCTGLYVVAVPAYVAEIAPQNKRGMFSSGLPLFNTLGMFLVICLGLALRWSWLAISIVILTIVSAVVMLFMPESPVWLIRQSRLGEAANGLKFFRGKDYPYKKEVQRIAEMQRDEQQNVPITWRDFKNPILYKPLLISIALMFFYAASGSGPIFAYTVEVFQRLGSAIPPDIAATILAAIQIVATLVCSLIIDKYGRRKLYIISGAATSLMLISLGVYSFATRHQLVIQSALGYIPLAFFAIYAFVFNIGMGPIPFVMIPEMVSVQYRSTVLSISTLMVSFFAFSSTKSYDGLRSFAGDYGVYWTYGFLSLFSVPLGYYILPETKNMSFEDISKSFSKRNSKAETSDL